MRDRDCSAKGTVAVLFCSAVFVFLVRTQRLRMLRVPTRRFAAIHLVTWYIQREGTRSVESKLVYATEPA